MSTAQHSRLCADSCLCCSRPRRRSATPTLSRRSRATTRTTSPQKSSRPSARRTPPTPTSRPPTPPRRPRRRRASASGSARWTSTRTWPRWWRRSRRRWRWRRRSSTRCRPRSTSSRRARLCALRAAAVCCFAVQAVPHVKPACASLPCLHRCCVLLPERGARQRAGVPPALWNLQCAETMRADGGFFGHVFGPSLRGELAQPRVPSLASPRVRPWAVGGAHCCAMKHTARRPVRLAHTACTQHCCAPHRRLEPCQRHLCSHQGSDMPRGYRRSSKM